MKVERFLKQLRIVGHRPNKKQWTLENNGSSLYSLAKFSGGILHSVVGTSSDYIRPIKYQLLVLCDRWVRGTC